MHPTVAENTEGVIEHLRMGAETGAEVVVLPECATTGYHRRVPEQVSRGLIDDAIARVRSECAALGVVAVVGTPWYPSAADDVVWNAAVAVDGRGEILAVCPKVGLTRGETRFFTAGAHRPRFSLGSAACGVVLCREVRDAATIAATGTGGVTFWPGVIGWESEVTDPDDDVTHELASECARALDTWLVQCNWAGSVNRPELTGTGGSLVLSPAGDVVYEAPRDVAGLFAYDLAPHVGL